jgi:hypothetical protein
MEEIWKDIPGYEGRYQASDQGRIRSLDRRVRTVSRFGTETTRLVKGRVLKPQTAWNANYLHVRIEDSTELIQHLVALAFIGPRPDGLEVAHNGGNPKNNAARNLRYATTKSNAEDKIAHGTSGKGSANTQAKLTDAQVLRVKSSTTTAKALAAELGVHVNHISRIRRGERWGHL